MAAHAEVIELSDDEEPAMSPRSRKRARRAAPPAAAASASNSTQQQFDLTADSDDNEGADAPSGGPTARSNAGAGSSSDAAGSSYITIDLCAEEDDQGGAFAKHLNLLFGGDVHVGEEGEAAPAAMHEVKEAKRTHASASASAADAIELGSDDDDAAAAGDGGGGGGGDREEDDDEEDADARLAARMQAAIDDDARKEAERLSAVDDHDAAIAARLQARLARDIAASEEASGPRDVLKAQRHQIKQWLQNNAKQLRVRDVWANPNAQPGGSLYTRFAAAYDSASDHGVRLVFHGTREENIEAICQHGLDPQRRGVNGQALGTGEYFADNVAISIPYCAGGSRMLVFAVLMDRSGLTKHQQGIVVINRPEHQLPMFVITFENAAAGHPGMRMPPALSAGAAGRLAAMGISAAQIARMLGLGGPAPPPPPRPPPAPRGSRAKGKARARR